MLTHANLVNNIEQCVSSVASQASDVVLAVLPFFHIYGMQVVMNDPTASRGHAGGHAPV